MARSELSILHLASDEKFIDAANYIFEKAFPGGNHFLIPKSAYNRKLIYIKNTHNIEIIPYNNRLISTLSRRTHDFNCIVMHGITELNSTVFLSSSNKEKFIGILWGAELYTQENFPELCLTGELTKSLELSGRDSSIIDKLKDIFRKIVYNKSVLIEGATKISAANLAYFCVPYIEEFEYFRQKRLISDGCRYIQFSYYPLEFIMKGNELLKITGNNILLGNSANSYNNHLEAFQILKNINTGDRKILVPLSYGDNEYADYIQKAGFDIFKMNFRPLRKYMPINEYVRELQSCGIVIMNHYRQQGVGNVLMMLYLGSKVFLNESSTLFHFLKRIGIRIFSIDKDLKDENYQALTNLSIDEMSHNRELLIEIFREDMIIERLKEDIKKYFK